MLSLCRQAKRARLLVVECQGVASQADARRRQRQPVFIRQRHLRRDPQRRVRTQLQVILAVRADRVGYHLLGIDILLLPVFSSVWQPAVASPMGQVVLAVRADQVGLYMRFHRLACMPGACGFELSKVECSAARIPACGVRCHKRFHSIFL